MSRPHISYLDALSLAVMFIIIGAAGWVPSDVSPMTSIGFTILIWTVTSAIVSFVFFLREEKAEASASPATKATKAYQKGQALYRELAGVGVFEGPGAMEMVERALRNNPYEVGSLERALFKKGFTEASK